MKITVLVLLFATSLAGNVAFYFQRNSTRAPTIASSASANPGHEGAVRNSVTGPGGDATATSAETAKIAETWLRLQSADLPTLVAQLRAAGFSPAMIRAIVAARVNEQFSARRKALLAQQEEQPFWKARLGYLRDAKTMSALRELGREQSDLTKQLLGTEGADGEEKLAYQRRQFGDLPRDKMDQMQNIVSDYSELRNQVYAAANGVMLPEDREKLTLLEKEQRADLAALLTPAELENYELRNSATANSLRSQLVGFNPTEDEFRAIFRLQQAFDDKYGSAATVASAEQYRQRQDQQQELLAQVKTVISADRVAAYQQSIDPAYQMINRLTARLELPASAATEVVAVQRDITKRASAMRADKNLAPDMRNLQLSALAQEASAKLTAVLGDRGLDAYKQYGGQWVQSLTTRPTVPSAKQ